MLGLPAACQGSVRLRTGCTMHHLSKPESVSRKFRPGHLHFCSLPALCMKCWGSGCLLGAISCGYRKGLSGTTHL